MAPVTQKSYPDGYARVRAWIPAGKWTDIFTGDAYEIGEGGKELTLLRGLESIPVLAKEGAILPLSGDNKNEVKNPEKLEVWVFEGSGAYSLYEDGLAEEKYSALMTDFTSQFVEMNGACMQVLTISSRGEGDVVPQNRTIKTVFKNATNGEVKLYEDDKEVSCEKRLSTHLELSFAFEAGKTYRVELTYPSQTRLEKLLLRAKKILTEAQAGNYAKERAWQTIAEATTVEEYLYAVERSSLDLGIKLRLKETL